MPPRSNPATPSRKHNIPPETSAEREAKRKHIESHGSLEEPSWDVKDELLPDDIVTGTIRASTQDGIAGATLNAESVISSSDAAHEILSMAIRLLASALSEGDCGYDMVPGALSTVIDRYLKYVNDQSLSGKSPPELDSWLTSLLHAMNLPVQDHLHRVSARLREDMANRIADSWLSEYDAASIPAVVAILEQVGRCGNVVVPGLIRLLQASQERHDVAKSPRAAATKKESKTAKKARSESEPTSMTLRPLGAGDERPRNGGPGPAIKDAGNSPRKRPTARKAKGTSSTKRCQTVPPRGSENVLGGSPKHGRTPSLSSPALETFVKGHAALNARSLGLSRGIGSAASTLSRCSSPAQNSPMQTVPASSTVVRFVRPGNSRLLVFFIGSGMSSVSEEDIDAACLRSFAARPSVSHLWSESIWVAEMENVPDVHSDVITLQGTQYKAEDINSCPSRYFVAYHTGTEIADASLKIAVGEELHKIFRKKSFGRVDIYRSCQDHKQSGRYVFLSLAKASPFSLFTVPLLDRSGQFKSLIFKPIIMEVDTPCFYCEEIHTDLICPEVEQMIKYKFTKSTNV